MIDPRTSLGKYFTVGEFLVSSSHPELLRDVELTEMQLMKLYYLVQFALDPLRAKFGQVHITSGYRPPMLNRLVDGSPTSQHLACEAADFIVAGADPYRVYIYLTNDLHWPGEVIWYPGRFHIALPSPGVKSDYIIKKKETMEV